MLDYSLKLSQVINRLRAAEIAAGRDVGSVQLLAVSKNHPASSIRELAALGQYRFGENYLQEAQTKITALADLNLEWHFIGNIQTNKTRHIAMLFHWAQTVDSWHIAKRLNDQRPPALPPLNIVSISGAAV